MPQRSFKQGTASGFFPSRCVTIHYACTISRYHRTELSQLAGSVRVVCATPVAFGMGMDLPNIGLVVHWDAADFFVDYVQQTGRAGRHVILRLSYTTKNCFLGLLTERSAGYCWVLARTQRRACMLAFDMQSHSCRYNIFGSGSGYCVSSLLPEHCKVWMLYVIHDCALGISPVTSYSGVKRGVSHHM